MAAASKIQDTYFCCIRDPELQFLRRDGLQNDEKTLQALHCMIAMKQT